MVMTAKELVKACWQTPLDPNYRIKKKLDLFLKQDKFKAMPDIDHLRTLPISERIQLVEDLWDSIAMDTEPVQLSKSQSEELDRRLDRFEESPQEGIEWSSLKARIQSSL